MTIKNSLISVAASALLISAMTGCSSSDSTPAATTTTGIQSSVKAVDGYIYNATLKAYYLADDNSTMNSVTLDSTKTTKNVADGVWTIGSPTYTINDANTSIKDRIKFFQLSYAASTSTATTFTPASFIESGVTEGSDANDTTLGTTFTMTALGNSGIMSPINDIIYQNVSSLVGTTTGAGTLTADYNTSFFTELENNATKLAANLGLSGVKLLTADPVETATTNPTFKLVNALLKGTGATAASTLMTATAPTTESLQATLQAVSDAGAGDTNALALTNDLLTRVKAGTFTTSDIATLNVDESVEQGSIVNKAAATLTGKLIINGVTVNGTNFETLTANGAKFASDTVSIDLNLSRTKTDANISNKSFTLYAQIQNAKDNVIDSDNNSSDSLLIALPFDVNYTNDATTPIGITVADSTLVSYEVKAGDGSAVLSKADFNATTLGVTSLINAGVAADNNITINVTGLLEAVKTSAEANLTSFLLETDKISNLQVILKDTDSATMRTTADGVNQINFASATVNNVYSGTISGTGISLIDLSTSSKLADLRKAAATTEANKAPSQVLSIDNEGGSGSVAVSPFVVNNNSNSDASLAADTLQSWETNNTFSITSEGSLATSITDKNSTYINTVLYNAADATGASAASNVFDFNTTSTDAGELNSTITYKITDEFGDSNTTYMYVRINRPAYMKASAFAAGTDGNITSLIGDYDGNGSIESEVAIAGVPAISAGQINFLDSQNILRTVAVGGTVEFNGSLAATNDTNYSLTFHSNGKIEIDEEFTTTTLSEFNITVSEVNVTDIYAADFNLTEADANTTY